jgi:hypothetical protein
VEKKANLDKSDSQPSLRDSNLSRGSYAATKAPSVLVLCGTAEAVPFVESFCDL